MADMEQGAKKVAELTLGVEGIYKALEEAKKRISEQSFEIGQAAGKELQEGLKQAQSAQKIDISKNIINDEAFNLAGEKIEDLIAKFGKLASVKKITDDKTGAELGNTLTFIDAMGVKTELQTKKLKDNQEQVTKIVTDNIKKRSEAEEKAHREEIKRLAKERTYEEKIAKEKAEAAQKQFNATTGYHEQEKLSEKEIFDIKYRWTERLKKQDAERAAAEAKAAREAEKKAQAEKKLYDSTIAQIDKMIAKQKEFTRTVDKQAHTPINKEIIAQSKEYTRELERMKHGLVEVGSVSEKTQADLNNMQSKVKVLAGTYQEAGFQGDSFLKKITDKAKWVSAFYIVDALKDALLESVQVIKETEEAAVELQRVLSKPVASEEITDKLYGIAYEYGRTFEEVQETAVKFAQAGNDWNESLSLTRSAMLALNTAELEVTESTNGLIAITSQWDLEASKTEEVIDKINITADNFAVTSQKIVAALQRASGSARQAGLEIDDTIAVITALSEATGRSGENIGTALNSLLIYTSKDKALKAFYEVGNETVRKTVDAYRSGAGSILDVWKALGQNMEQLSEKQKDILYQGIGGDEFAQHLEDNASEITDDIKKVYGSVGTFRQNYFIALLNDIDKVDEVTRNMDKAVGYSAEENKKQMETLTASFRQLIDLWKHLVVEAGEGKLGLMSLFKLIVDIGIGLGKVVKVTGGLTPLLGLVAGVLIKIKAVQINNMFLDMAVSMEKFSLKIKEAGGGLKGFLAVMRTSKGAAEGFAASLGTLQIALSLVAMAYSAITTAVTTYLDKKKDEREQSIINFNAKTDEAKATTKLYNEYVALKNEYEKTGEKSERFISVTNQLATSLGITGEYASDTGDKFDTLAGKIENAKEELFGFSKLDADLQVKNAKEEFEAAAKGEKGLFGIPINDIEIDATSISKLRKDIKSEIEDVFEGVAVVEKSKGKMVLAPIEGRLEEFEKAVREAKSILDSYYDTASESEKEGMKNLGSILKGINLQLEESYVAYEQAIIKQIAMNDEIPKTAEAYRDWKQEILSTLDVDEELQNQLGVFIDEMFPHFAEELEKTTEQFSINKERIETLHKAIESLNDVIDSMQSGYGTVNSVVQEFNDKGYLTIDTLQALVNSGYDYINLLEFTEKGVQLNKQAVEELNEQQRENVKEMVKVATATQILEVAQKYLNEANGKAKDSAIDLGTGLQGLEGDVLNVTGDFFNGAIAANEFANAMQRALNVDAMPETVDTEAMMKEIETIAVNGKKTLDLINYTFEANQKGTGDATKKRYDAEKKEIQKLKEAENDRYKDEKKRIDDLKKAIKEKYDAEQKELKKRKDALKDQFDREKEALERQKDLVKDRYDEQIDKLKEVQRENDRIDKQEEYLRNRREAEKDKNKASVRSGIEYREAEEEAEQKISDLDREWNKVVRDWKVEDEIKALEQLRDAQIQSIEIQIKMLEDKHKLEMDNMDKLIEKSKEREEVELKAQEDALKVLTKQHEAVIKGLEERLKAMDDASKAGATSFKKNFLDTTETDATNTAKRLSKTALNAANYTAQELHDIYMREFFDKIKKEQEEMQKLIISTAKTGLDVGFSSALHGGGSRDFGLHGGGSRPFSLPMVDVQGLLGLAQATAPSTTTYNSTTTNSRSNITTNVFGDSNAKKTYNSFFTKP